MLLLSIQIVLAAMAAAAFSSFVSLTRDLNDPLPCFPVSMAKNGTLDVIEENEGSIVPPIPLRYRLSVWDPPNHATKDGPSHHIRCGRVGVIIA